MELDVDSLERLVPDAIRPDDATGQETLQLHLARYQFAAAHVRPPRVLDIACGVGYGTHFLATHSSASLVIGVDLSQPAVAHARERYGSPRVQFVASDAMEFMDAAGFDTIVSLETIEHLADPETFVARLARQLRPAGVFIASVRKKSDHTCHGTTCGTQAQPRVACGP